jgi:tRNA nucleotidyltransferase (CCA-adding enzyme)
MQTEDFYLVWGVVRDLLLGIDKPIIDIDITGPHHPDQWWDMINKNNISTFRTEKFGTMTMIRQQEATRGNKRQQETKKVLLIHWWGNQPWDDACLTGVAEVLQNQWYEVIFEHYDYAHQTDFSYWFDQICIHDADIVIGHSAGAYLALQYAQVKPISQVICIAPTTPTNGNSNLFTDKVTSQLGNKKAQEFFDFHAREINTTKIATQCHFIYGAKDDIVDQPIQNYYKQLFPQALVDILPNRGHMGGDEGVPRVEELNSIILNLLDYHVVPPRNDEKEKNLWPMTYDLWPISYEITPFRQEWGYEDFRHPWEIQWSDSLLDDAKRRDFTINCLYYKQLHQSPLNPPFDKGDVRSIEFDPEKYAKQWYWYDEASGTLCVCNHNFIEEFKNQNIEEVIFRLFDPLILWSVIHLIVDPYQWLVDLCEWTLRCVGDPDHRFQEDALRILRGLRFVNTLNQAPPRGDTLLLSQIQWDFHRDTWRSMQKYHFLVQHLAKERIKQEITKVFSMKNPFGYVALLDELKLLPLIFPAVAKIKWLEQPVRYHPLDTYHHTLMVLRHTQKLNQHYLVKLAALYHDVGKAEQYKLYWLGLTREEMTLVHGSWLNHTACGPDFVRRDFSALWFSSAEIDTIARLVEYHMYPGQILMSKPDKQIKKLRTLLAQSSYEQMQDLLDLVEGDRLWHYNPIQSQAELDGPQQLRTMLDKIYHDEGQITLKSLTINGQILMSELRLEPSRALGQLLQKCLEYVLNDPSRNTKEELLKFAKKEYKKINL